MVESGGLENRCVGNPCTEGSNPSPSAPQLFGDRVQRDRRPVQREAAISCSYDEALNR